MGSSSQSTTESSPPDWNKGVWKQVGTDIGNLYNNNVGNGVFEGSTVAPLSGTTMSGVNQLANAGANTNTSGSRPLFQGIGSAATAPTSAQSNLSGMASGAYLDPANDPYYSRALQSALTTAGNNVQSQFSGAGRLGSAADTNALGNTLGNIAVNAASQQYNQNVANQLAANQQIDTSNQAGLGLGLNAANSIAGLDQNQFNNNLTGANATLQAGNLLDTQAQKNQNDLVNLYYSNLMQPWNYIGVVENALSGNSGNYGMQNSRTSSSNPLAAAGLGLQAIGK